MTWITALACVLALVAVATVLGWAFRQRSGRVRVPADPGQVTAADVAGAEPFGPAATLLQFSSAYCSACPATHRMLDGLAGVHGGVRHIDVDVTHRPDLVRRFGIMSTPTTLVLDSEGLVRARVSGPPDRDALAGQLDRMGAGANA